MLVIQRSSASQLRAAAARTAAATAATRNGRAHRPVAPSSLPLSDLSTRSYSTARSSVLSSPSPSSSRLPSSFLTLRHNSTEPPALSPPSEKASSTAPTAPFLPPSEYTLESALDAVPLFKTLSPPPTLDQCNILLSSLAQHQNNEVSKALVAVYFQMLDLDLQPTSSTLARVVLHFCKRDALRTSKTQAKLVDPNIRGRLGVSINPSLAFSSAIAIFRAAVARPDSPPFETDVYEALLSSAALHKDPQTAREIFLEMERRSLAEGAAVAVSYAALTSLVKAFAFTNSAAVKVVLETFRTMERDGTLAVTRGQDVDSQRQSFWEATTRAYLVCGDVDSAKELFTQVAIAPPPPSPSSSSEAFTSPIPSSESNSSDSTTLASLSYSDTPPAILPSTPDAGLPTFSEASPSSSSPTFTPITSLETASESSDPSPVPHISASRVIKALFDSPEDATLRRDFLPSFLDHAVSLPLPKDDLRAAFSYVIRCTIKNADSKQLVSFLRLVLQHRTEKLSPIVYLGIHALVFAPFARGRHLRDAFEIATEVLKTKSLPFPREVGEELLLGLAGDASGPSPAEVTALHRLALWTHSENFQKNYQKGVLARLLQRVSPQSRRQLDIIVGVVNVGQRSGIKALGNLLGQDIGRFSEIWSRAKAQVGGDVVRLDLTSSSVGALFQLLAAQDQLSPRPLPSSSRRPRVSLVEEFVQDLINAGDALGVISVYRPEAFHATNLLAESVGKAEAKLLMEPFLEESNEDIEKEIPDEMEAEKVASTLQGDVDSPSQQPDGKSTVEGEDVEPASQEQEGVIKISQQVFDFEDAPWRSLVMKGKGLIELLPEPSPSSSSLESTPELKSVSEPSSSEPVAEAAPPSKSPSFLDQVFPPAADFSSESSAAASSSSKTRTSKADTEAKAKATASKVKSNARRAAQLADARLQTILKLNLPETAISSYHLLRDILTSGHVPTPSLVSQVADALGRRFEHQKVVEVVSLLEHISEGVKVWDRREAIKIHSDIITAFAYCRDLVSTEYHRQHLLEKMGARPTSQAYGALIFNGEDTTGDASYAVELWREARETNKHQTHRHLYNGMMKALGKVGKAEEAVKMLESMRETKGRATPSWASFGFAIEACLQADMLSEAERLYRQMQQETSVAERREFRPSILPFTSLMRHYAIKELDRDAILAVDGDLRDLDLVSHSYTYDVLINAYGAIQPVDKDTMWDVIELLEANETQHARIQGFHWASAIRCLGADDFPAALATFDGILSRASSFGKNPALPDVVAYQAILEVAQTHGETDVVKRITGEMESGLMPSTAKAELLIKTFGGKELGLGDMERARKVFEETTSDEPVDLLLPLRPDPSAPPPHPSAPIYRLGSTWDALIRLEVEHGNLDEAKDLLKRMRAVEWKQNQRPTATILSLGELLGVETGDEVVESVAFDVGRDLGRRKTGVVLEHGREEGSVGGEESVETMEVEAVVESEQMEGEVVEAVEGEVEAAEKERGKEEKQV